MIATPDPSTNRAEATASPAVEDREAEIDRYRRVRAWTEAICEPLAAEDQVIQSMPDASPTKWHLAHTSWFFHTFILGAGSLRDRIDPRYAFLYNSYYNAVGPMHCRAQRGMISRPTLEEVRDYRRIVDDAMMRLLADAPEEAWRELRPVVELGLHHEQQHQELLLTDMKHLFAQNPLRPAYRPAVPAPTGAASPPGWVSFPEGIHEIGADGEGFCFDNEKPRHRVLAGPFQLATRLVTNGEFLAFVEDGGYERPEFWLSLGWMTVRDQKWTAPLYWERDAGGEWAEFTLGGVAALGRARPVTHVSLFEADAFARWSGARLPTEAEWEIASRTVPVEGNFVEAERWHPVPAADPAGALHQMFGDVWEWTRSAYGPYPGYAAAPGAIGEYNSKFMCNQYVLRGGSCASARSHVRRTYRNFFPPEKRWQFTGIRLARDGA